MNYNSIANFARDLVRIPSQGGIDDPETILTHAHNFGRHTLGLPMEILESNKNPIALGCTITGQQPGPI